MNWQKVLRWYSRMALPVSGWRVRVELLRGPARGTGREVALLCAGEDTEFFQDRFFADKPVVQRSTCVPVWRLLRQVDEWRRDADLVVVESDRISARLFLRTATFLCMPQWVSCWMQVPEDLQEYGRRRPNCLADIRRGRIKKFECHTSRDEQDFDLFFDKFYKPHLLARFGADTRVPPRFMLRYVFRQGMLIWLTRDGEKLAGEVVTMQGREISSRLNGVLDGRHDLLKEGVLSVLYVHSIREAQRLGCTVFNMGGSLPSLHDGVLRYKSKWSSGLKMHDGFKVSNLLTMVSWNRISGPTAEFLSHTSLIYHDGDGFSALWVFPEELPLTAESLKQQYMRLRTAGLRRFDILLPEDIPAGFDCPAGVHLHPRGAQYLEGPECLRTHVPALPSPASARPGMADGPPECVQPPP